jgi:uncharacterized protein YdeI (YjbR/CyaY-like superfamily)
MKPTFFATPAEFRAWLERHHADETELLVGFYKKSSGRPSITWSAVNIKRAGELIEEGRMTPAGRGAFEERTDDRSAIYSYEQRRNAQLEPDQQARFEANAGAWAWFQEQPPSYRRAAIHWVTSAKRPQTRESRLAALIADSAASRSVKPLTRPGGK